MNSGTKIRTLLHCVSATQALLACAVLPDHDRDLKLHPPRPKLALLRTKISDLMSSQDPCTLQLQKPTEALSTRADTETGSGNILYETAGVSTSESTACTYAGFLLYSTSLVLNHPWHNRWRYRRAMYRAHHPTASHRSKGTTIETMTLPHVYVLVMHISSMLCASCRSWHDVIATCHAYHRYYAVRVRIDQAWHHIAERTPHIRDVLVSQHGLEKTGEDIYERGRRGTIYYDCEPSSLTYVQRYFHSAGRWLSHQLGAHLKLG